jgi:hypothetical protein
MGCKKLGYVEFALEYDILNSICEISIHSCAARCILQFVLSLNFFEFFCRVVTI